MLRIRCLCTVMILPLWMPTANAQSVVEWEVDNLERIDGLATSVSGDPRVVQLDGVDAVEFDGVDDGLFVEGNPLSGATEFTIEVVFNPYSGGGREQRFVHFQQDDDNRVLIELRIEGGDRWFLDTFVKSGASSRALYAESFLHPTDTWQHAALVYRDGVMTHFVNGAEELSGSVDYRVVTGGRASLGVRLNEVSHFKGMIRSLRVTHRALSRDAFQLLDDAGPGR